MSETQQEVKQEATKKDTPKQFSLSNCKLTEFENKVEGKDYTYKSIKVSKFYKDAKKEWQETDTFSPNELTKLKLLIEEYERFNNPMKAK